MAVNRRYGFIFIFIFFILVSRFIESSSRMCSSHKFASKRVYNSCRDLRYLHAHIHWDYNQTTGEAQVAYRAREVSHGWVAWAINPNQTGMVGSEALVAFRNADGTMAAYTSLINSYNPSMLPANLSFRVSNLKAEYSDNEIIIYANVGPLRNGSLVHHVWQSGGLVLDDIPQMHSVSLQNLQSIGVLDFLS